MRRARARDVRARALPRSAWGYAEMTQTAKTLKDLQKGEWSETTAEFELPEKFREASEIQFVLPKGAKLLIDDVLLF